MKFKDFGLPTIVELSKDFVSVSTTTPEDSKQIQDIQHKNKKFIDPSKTSMNTSSTETKIFSVKYKSNIVGQIILWDFQKNNNNISSCSISYWISQDVNNRGIGTLAVELICSYAFEDLKVNEIDATIQEENKSSIRLIEKLKYTHRKTIGDPKVLKGQWQNFIVYTIENKYNAVV